MALSDGLEHRPVTRHDVRPSMFALDEPTSCFAHRAGRRRIAEQPGYALSERPDRRSGDDETGLLRDDGLRRTAGVAGDRRAGAGLGLQIDEAEAFDLEACVSAAARHREDVAGSIVGREILLG